MRSNGEDEERLRLARERAAQTLQDTLVGSAPRLTKSGFPDKRRKRATGRVVPLAPLYQGDNEETIEVSDTVVALLEQLGARDLASCNEELLEKALAAYIAKHPKGGEGLPSDWPSTFDAARAEIEGRTTGVFKPGFTAELAASARAEMARQAVPTNRAVPAVAAGTEFRPPCVRTADMALTREQYRLIGRNLRTARWRAGLQRSEIAKRLGLTEAIKKDAEHGAQGLTSPEIQILCRIYRIDVRSVFRATPAR